MQLSRSRGRSMLDKEQSAPCSTFGYALTGELLSGRPASDSILQAARRWLATWGRDRWPRTSPDS